MSGHRDVWVDDGVQYCGVCGWATAATENCPGSRARPTHQAPELTPAVIDPDAYGPRAFAVVEIPAGCTPQLVSELTHRWKATTGMDLMVLGAGVRLVVHAADAVTDPDEQESGR